MIKVIFGGWISYFKSQNALVLENTLLRYQLEILSRRRRRVALRRVDRLILLWFSRRLADWERVLVMVQPQTIVRWHREGFALYWKWRHGKRGGRNPIHPNAIDLIKEISTKNPGWGVPRIHGELLKLGVRVCEATVYKYRVRRKGPRGQDWKTFLKNHMSETIAIDFFVVPTIKFKLLWVLVVLSHDRRKILRTAVTCNPSSPWTRQQIRNAFPFAPLPKYLLHDRDGNFVGLSKLGMEEVITSFRSPWQNAYVERAIGSIRRECVDHVIPLSEEHLEGILKEYVSYYNGSRTHLSLNKDSPQERGTEYFGKVVTIPRVGGLHHEFRRVAA